MSARKQAVIEAATKLLAVNPRASTQEIAAAAGISRATLHRLFSSRDALVEAIAIVAVEKITAAFATARLEEGTMLEALQRLVEELVPMVHQFAFLISETQIQESEGVMAGDRELQRETEALMRRGQDEGTLRADLPTAWLPYILSGLLLSAEEAVRHGNIAPREAPRLVLESFLRGAAASSLLPALSYRRPIRKDLSVTDAQMHEPDTASCPFRFDLRDPHMRANALSIYARLREQEPLAPAILTTGEDDERDFTGTFGREVLLATDYQDTLETLTDERFSVNGLSLMTPERRAELPPVPEAFRPLQRNLLSLDPPDHTRLRRLVQPSWTPRALEGLRPRVQAIADELIDEAERSAAERGESAPHRTVELVNAFAYPLPMTVISELLGVPKADRAQVRIWSEALIDSQLLGDAAETAVTAFSAYLQDLFAQKRRQPFDDMTTHLVQAEEEGDKLDDEELLSMVFILIVAGHVTTVNLIGSAVLALLNHPAQLERLKANPELVTNAVEETLRFWGPVEMASPRFAREGIVLDGKEIAAGKSVFPVLAAANRDPARFADPDRFDIERKDASRHVAFGKGVHLCLGAPLARIEGQVAVETLFRRWPEMRLAEPLAEAPLHQNLFRGPERLLLEF